MRTGIADGVVFARDIVAFVSVSVAGSGKDIYVCLDVLVVGKKNWFQWLDRLSVSMKV